MSIGHGNHLTFANKREWQFPAANFVEIISTGRKRFLFLTGCGIVYCSVHEFIL
jgi:hypothetical protein